jgi:tRNA pseudouridine32 synthase/23S rRNA pseudouridine746 synthase
MTPLAAAEIQARVLHRDGLVLVLDKPAGLPVHRPSGAGQRRRPCLEDSFEHLRFGLPRPPALAHRLDAATSGCLALGRHRKALATLSELFRENAVEKTYWALVVGAPAEESGRIALPLARREAPPRMEVASDGLPSATAWRVRARLPEATWLEVRPHTGRMHQIRAHLAALGCPILGDPLYGGERTGAGDGVLQLHARSLVIPLRKSKPPLVVTAPPPPHMAAFLPDMALDPEIPEPTGIPPDKT